MEKNFSVKYRIWIFSGKEKVFGIGRIELLEKIKKTGSISTAAAQMKMSYRQAWQMVNEMNDRAGKPLVEKQLGGKSGGGSVVTPAGINAIRQFNLLEQEVGEFIRGKIKKMNF